MRRDRSGISDKSNLEIPILYKEVYCAKIDRINKIFGPGPEGFEPST
jgi:hypothetical protein